MMMVMPRSFSCWKIAHDLDAGAAVEIAGRFVGQQHLRLVDERARNRHALLLAAGKLAGMMILAAGEADDARTRSAFSRMLSM